MYKLALSIQNTTTVVDCSVPRMLVYDLLDALLFVSIVGVTVVAVLSTQLVQCTVSLLLLQL
jgi:hypothetical protein